MPAPSATHDPEVAARRQALLDHLSRLLPDPGQRTAFDEAMSTEPPPALRLNPLMSQAGLLKPAVSAFAEAVPWCDHAFVLTPGRADRCRLGLSLEYALGAVYIQAKATTLAVEALDPQPGERVLDLAAAPGGKASHIAAAMANQGLLVVNEPRRRRMPSLVGNLERLGVHNVVFTQSSGTLLARHFHNFFDRVLLDAPCSGDGILCKDEAMLRYWSPEDAARKAQIQIGLLRAAFHMLRPGGVLVYSTCSLSTEENEDVVAALCHRYPGQVELLPPLEGIAPAPLPPDMAADYPAEFARVTRVWPHLHRTEGAFVARLRKIGEPTQWRHCEGDLGRRLEESDSDSGAPVDNLADGTADLAGDGSVDSFADGAADGSIDSVAAVVGAIESCWDFHLSPPDSAEIAVAGKRINIRPRCSSTLKTHLPSFIRAGMRLASRHKGYAYLSQQSVTLWGHLMDGPSVELTWSQVQEAFREGQVQLREPLSLRGDVICRFGPWTVCRGLIESGVLKASIPKILRTSELCRLTGV